MESDQPSQKQLFTIGHSNQPIEKFLDLLIQNHVEVLADVRTSPYSKYASQFNREDLQAAVKQKGLKYVFLGGQLGGRPFGDVYYDEDGRVRYDVQSRSKPFLEGIARLMDGISRFRVAIMCGEENPEGCHRRLLIGRVMESNGIAVSHIRGDGRIETEGEIKQRESAAKETKQEEMFVREKAAEWKSIRSVLHKKALPNSSESSEEMEFADY